MINEVMYNPAQCIDSEGEWIELYNSDNKSLNISECKIDGKNFDGAVIEGHGYLVVAGNLEKFTEYFGNVPNAVAGNLSLTNSGDKIELTGDNCSDSLDYSRYVGWANGNNQTLEKNKDGEWKESIVEGGTPGEKNSVYDYSYDFTVLEIVEIMADPIGSDEGLKPLGEWVEIFNSGDDPIYLEGLVLYDEYDNHKLAVTDTNAAGGLEMGAGEYKVIYRDGDGDFALSGTTEDKVRLFYENSRGKMFDEVVFAGAVEGMSWSKINGEWYKTAPSPGAENVYTAGCDWEIQVLPMESVFNLGQDVGFNVIVRRIYGEPEVVSVRGQVENIFGETIKTYKPWTNETITTVRSKTYTPNLKNEIYKIIFNLTGLNCQDSDLTNNIDSRLIVISPYYKIFNSSLRIEKVYLGNDEKAEWGDRVRVKVNIYKGDETKYNVELFAEDDSGNKVSKTTKTSAHEKFTNYTLTLPVQLEPNCDHYYEDGHYNLVLEGLDKEAKTEIKIEGLDSEVCQKTSGVAAVKGKFGFKLLDKPETIEEGENFNVRVELEGDEENHQVKLWSYLYRGSKCYSGEREENLKEITLKPGETKIVELEIKPDDDLKAGDYKLKVKLNKDKQKTNKEITDEIKVEEKEEIKQCVTMVEEGSGVVENQSFQEKLLRLEREKFRQGKVVYLSSSYRAKEYIPIILATVFGLLSLVLVCRKPLMK